ncbi:Acetylcholine receptor subunit alpha [Bulinus truncatus]|nr:Acetylcholine receptor subunit alpha [Bulinus truncatus]
MNGLLSFSLTSCLFVQVVLSQSYNSTVAIMKDLVENGDYHPAVRPLKNQSRIMPVYVDFELVSIVGIDDVAQSFTANGFLLFGWIDEMLQWDPSVYDGQTTIHPVPEKIWRPRVVLMNTLGDRDLFKDDVAPVFIGYTGEVGWAPGSLFPVSCELQLADYPFDEQTCTISLAAMTFKSDELIFVAASPNVKFDFFVRNGEWDLKDSKVNVTTLYTATWSGSTLQLMFVLQRQPAFILLNIVLPVVFLSFLNIMVFVIPADSGEKISYGITVLLALSVFLSIVSSMLPRVGTNAPKLTIYLFILLIISMLTVIVSIVIVYLAHKDEMETKSRKAKANFKNALNKTQKLTRAISTMKEKKVEDDISKTQDKVTSFSDALKMRSFSPVDIKDDAADAKPKKTSPGINKYRLIGKHIDFVSFVVFMILWAVVTVGFLLDMAL